MTASAPGLDACPPGPSRPSERGSGTAVGLGLAAVGLVLFVVVVAVLAAAAAQARAQTGADLGALSGALTLQSGGDVCSAAARAAQGSGAELRSCVVEGEDVIVEASSAIGGGVAGKMASAVAGGAGIASARAGPVR
ncbi:Rv3654c family TadE-like protein [Salana multivorans]